MMTALVLVTSSLSFRRLACLARFLLVLIQLLQGALTIQQEAQSSYGKWRVLDVRVRSGDELRWLQERARESSFEEADFWHIPMEVNTSGHVMVSPRSSFQQRLTEANMSFTVRVDDLERQLREQSHLQRRWEAARPKFKDAASRSLPRGALPLGQFHSYKDIIRSLREIVDHAKQAELIDIGESAEGRRIQGIKFGVDDGVKEVVILDGGMHAREWLTVHTILYFINNFAQPSASKKVSAYLQNLVIYIFPVMNPDGYEFTRKDEVDPGIRMWRKSRGRQNCTVDENSKRCCKGIDLNRNFDFRFAEIGSSRYACSEIYHGPHAFSEPETRALRDLFYTLKDRVRAYITLHAYSQLWIYSYSHRKTTYPKEIGDIRDVAAKAVGELSKLYGTQYKFGTGPEIIYGFAGGSTDWATESRKVKYSYTVELRPTFSIYNGFVVHPSELMPTGRETWEGVKVVLDRVLEEQFQRQNSKTQATGSCMDRKSSCAFWLSSSPSICMTSPATMRRDCTRSCGFCK